MIKVLDCKKKNYISQLNLLLKKRRFGDRTNLTIVNKIIDDIKKKKIKALLQYEKRYSNNTEIKPSKEKISKTINSLDPKIKNAIDFAYNRIFKFHSKQKIKNIKYTDNLNNKLEYKYVPIESIGIYVPANLPSTLLMNAIPAKIAKVKRIVLANPKLNGKLNAAVLYAAKKLKINEIYSMGGVQAISSLAYIQKVNKIVGPGNIYVASAKKKIFGDVGIEGMIAGPSEICVVGDKSTSVNEIVTSLIGQAEHDVNSQSVLITKDGKLLENPKKQISKTIKNLPRKKIAEKSLKKNGLLIKVYSDKQLISVINQIAPEHLELNINNYKNYLSKIYNVGSVCIGKYSAMAVTDYNAGTNHVLPTFGSAKYSSGLSLNEFYKKISHITLSKKGVEKIGEYATHLAEHEELEGHAQSIRSRMRR